MLIEAAVEYSLIILYLQLLYMVIFIGLHRHNNVLMRFSCYNYSMIKIDKPVKIKPAKHEHYVNNKEFSQSVVDYVIASNKAVSAGMPDIIITEYIGTCLLKIAEGLSRKPNFIRYTYREEMVMDGVENCLKAVNNYNVSAATRSGAPNAFAYFTQICYFAFLRRIAKEKKQQDIKILYMEQASIQSFANFDDEDNSNAHVSSSSIVERVRNKLTSIHRRDAAIKTFGKMIKTKKKQA